MLTGMGENGKFNPDKMHSDAFNLDKSEMFNVQSRQDAESNGRKQEAQSRQDAFSEMGEWSILQTENIYSIEEKLQYEDPCIGMRLMYFPLWQKAKR